jgi:hypothetical protein
VRKGRIDAWREELSPELIGRIQSALGKTMEQAGYPLV